MSPGARRWSARALLVCASMGLFLGAAELVFRATLAVDDTPGGDGDDEWYTRYRRMNETLYRRSEDPELVYEPAPGSSVEMEYGEAAFNDHGLREAREVSLHPGADIRVAVVGDSIVWGEFLDVNHAPAQQLDDALGEGFEAVNFGVSGYDTSQEAAYYEQTVSRFHPAIVVVVFCLNDFLIMSGPFERFANDTDRARKDAQEAWMEEVAPVRRETIEGVLEQRERDATVKLLARGWGLYQRARFDGQYTDEYLVSFGDRPRRERTSAAIRRLGRAIEGEGARGLFVISPVLESWDDYRWNEIHTHVEAVAREAGFEVLDPLAQWRGAQDPSSMRFDTIHYDQSGSRVFAETVSTAVRELAR